jgi:hypothetical protein
VTTGEVVGTAVTDGNGYYLFPVLPAGTDRYTVAFTNLPPNYGFTTNSGPVSGATNSDANPTTGITLPATVIAGQINTNVDAGIKPTTPLGVTFGEFNANANECQVRLTWTTTSEINTARFEVLRRVNNVGSFVNVGSVIAKGNSNTAQSYSFADANATTGRYEYKLKVVDLDGKQSYSDVKVVNTNCNDEEVKVYPNPITGNNLNVSITATAKDNYTLYLYDVAGKIVYESSVDVEGKMNVSIPMDSLANGQYTLKVTSSNSTKAIKVQKNN